MKGFEGHALRSLFYFVPQYRGKKVPPMTEYVNSVFIEPGFRS